MIFYFPLKNLKVGEYKENTSFLDFFRHFEQFWKEKFSVNFPLFILRKKFMSHRPMSKIFDDIKSSSEVLTRRPHFLRTWRIDFPSFSQNCHSSHFLALCWNSKNGENMAIFAQFGFSLYWQRKGKQRLIFWILA